MRTISDIAKENGLDYELALSIATSRRFTVLIVYLPGTQEIERVRISPLDEGAFINAVLDTSYEVAIAA